MNCHFSSTPNPQLKLRIFGTDTDEGSEIGLKENITETHHVVQKGGTLCLYEVLYTFCQCDINTEVVNI